MVEITVLIPLTSKVKEDREEMVGGHSLVLPQKASTQCLKTCSQTKEMEGFRQSGVGLTTQGLMNS
jgi:hypothetical protein